MSPTTLSTARAGRHARATLGFELQSALRFALAVAVAIAAVVLAWSEPAAIVLLPLAGALGALGLAVIAVDPREVAVRPAEHARWDGTLAAAFAVATVGLALAGSPLAAIAAGIAALALATLRLRTRYVV